MYVCFLGEEFYTFRGKATLQNISKTFKIKTKNGIILQVKNIKSSDKRQFNSTCALLFPSTRYMYNVYTFADQNGPSNNGTESAKITGRRKYDKFQLPKIFLLAPSCFDSLSSKTTEEKIQACGGKSMGYQCVYWVSCLVNSVKPLQAIYSNRFDKILFTNTLLEEFKNTLESRKN